jgi:hypothetical protein
MLVKSLTSHFGCKRMQAPGIVEVLGPHQAYWGLCAGSLSVLFAKPRSRQEVGRPPLRR